MSKKADQDQPSKAAKQPPGKFGDLEHLGTQGESASRDGNRSEHNEEEEKLAQLDKEELDKIADEDEEDLKLLKQVRLQMA